MSRKKLRLDRRPRRFLVSRSSRIEKDLYVFLRFALHARLGEVKNVSTEVSERQALSNLMRCSRSREPIMTHDSVLLFPTVSCWPRSENLVKRLRSCVGTSRLLEWFLLFLATMVSSQFQAARSWERFFACGLYFNALRRARKAYLASSIACSSSILSPAE